MIGYLVGRLNIGVRFNHHDRLEVCSLTSFSLEDRLLFANKLEKLIGNKDKRAFCKELNIRYDSLLDWLGARRFPSKQSIEKLSIYFGISTNSLIGKQQCCWHMSDEEIEISYKQAKNQKEQIVILSDLNDVPVKMMKQKLESLGLLKGR